MTCPAQDLPHPPRYVAEEYDGFKVDLDTGQFTHHDLVPGWLVEGQVRMDPGKFALRWLSVRPIDPESPDRVTSRLLRAVPVAVLLNAIRQRLLLADRQAHVVGDGTPGSYPHRSEPRANTRLADPRKQALLRLVAIAYIKEQGQPGVYARLARKFRRDTDAIKTLVRAARSDGWLDSNVIHGARGAGPGSRLLEDGIIR